MIEIMTEIHNKYVPSVEIEMQSHIESIGESITFKVSESHKILMGGDQLTAARARAAKRNVANADSDDIKLVGLLPTVEDWHTKMNLLSVSKSIIMLCIYCIAGSF